MMTFSLSDPNIWGAFLSLSVLEIVLGIDNVVFLALVVTDLPQNERKSARKIGLSLALVMRVLLLLSLSFVIKMTAPLFTVMGQDVSWRDLVLMAGGLFLLAKGTHEIHRDIEGEGNEEPGSINRAKSFPGVVAQLVAIDLVFSIDSIVTAIGIAEHVEVMIAAVMIAIILMYFASGALSGFIEAHPTTKMLALSFLLLIGCALIADGLHFHIPRGYIYFAMAFAGAVEAFNILAFRNKRKVRPAE